MVRGVVSLLVHLVHLMIGCLGFLNLHVPIVLIWRVFCLEDVHLVPLDTGGHPLVPGGVARGVVTVTPSH